MNRLTSLPLALRQLENTLEVSAQRGTRSCEQEYVRVCVDWLVWGGDVMCGVCVWGGGVTFPCTLTAFPLPHSRTLHTLLRFPLLTRGRRVTLLSSPSHTLTHPPNPYPPTHPPTTHLPTRTLTHPPPALPLSAGV
jgi:hypothetical protein